MKFNRDNIRTAVAEYIYFILDNRPENAEDAAKYDRKRRDLHGKIFIALGVDGDVVKDTGIAESIGGDWKKAFGSEDNLIDYHTDRLLCKFYNQSGDCFVELAWEFKERICHLFAYHCDRLNKRLELVNSVMQRAQDGLKAWNEDQPKGARYLPSWEAGIDIHDWNAYRDRLRREFREMQNLAELPRETFTKPIVKRFFEEPMERCYQYVVKLESLAFRAVCTKFYTYPIKEDNK